MAQLQDEGAISCPRVERSARSGSRPAPHVGSVRVWRGAFGGDPDGLGQIRPGWTRTDLADPTRVTSDGFNSCVRDRTNSDGSNSDGPGIGRIRTRTDSNGLGRSPDGPNQRLYTYPACKPRPGSLPTPLMLSRAARGPPAPSSPRSAPVPSPAGGGLVGTAAGFQFTAPARNCARPPDAWGAASRTLLPPGTLSADSKGGMLQRAGCILSDPARHGAARAER